MFEFLEKFERIYLNYITFFVKISNFLSFILNLMQIRFFMRTFLWSLKVLEGKTYYGATKHTNTSTQQLEILEFSLITFLGTIAATQLRVKESSVYNEDVAHLKSTATEEKFNLICLANHFQTWTNEEVHWLPLKLSLLSTFNEKMKTTHNTEKFAIHEILRLFFFFSKKFHFHYWQQKSGGKTHIYLNKVVSWRGTPMKICIQKGHYRITIAHFNCITWPNC